MENQKKSTQNSILFCDKCHDKIIPKDEDDIFGCDFCNSLLCDKCQDKYYISYHKCDTCNWQWCYYNGLYTDYTCPKGKKIGECEDCGY